MVLIEKKTIILIITFPRSKYTQDGEERFAATTQFESTDARRAFPCWDEPALKSTFSISVSAPKNRVALSNMPIIEETPDTDDPEAYRVCHFDKTPKMSTYLVAFIVGEFEAVEATTDDGILVRVWTPMVIYSQINRLFLFIFFKSKTYKKFVCPQVCTYVFFRESLNKGNLHWIPVLNLSIITKISLGFPILCPSMIASLSQIFQWVPWKIGDLLHSEKLQF